MRCYELMVIIDGDLDDSDAHAWVRTLSDMIGAAGGSVHGNPDWWGRRRFAFPIAKKDEGFYVVLNVLAQPGALDDFERALRIADEIVRHKLIRLPDAEAERRGMATAAA